MNTVLKWLAVMASLAGVLMACEEKDKEPQEQEESLTLSQEAVTLSPEGGSATVVLTSSVAWIATPSATWLKVSPDAGNAGSTRITVSAGKNDSGQDRSGTVRISAGTKSASVSVSQKKAEQGTDPQNPETPGNIDGLGGDVNDWDEGGDSTYHKD